MSLEVIAVLAGGLSVAFAMAIAWCICSYLDHANRSRLERDKRDLSRIDMP